MVEKVQLSVIGLTFSQSQRGAYALILNEEDGKRRLPIIIGGFEAQAIAIELEQMKPPRPLTHDLFRNFAKAFSIIIKQVYIYDLVEGVFYARLICEDKDRIEVEIDSRTSDAIALALRFNAPIYTTKKILNEAGIIIEEVLSDIIDDDENNDKNIETEDKTKNSDTEFGNFTETELKRIMQEAIEKEEYEKASKIRDELNRRSDTN